MMVKKMGEILLIIPRFFSYEKYIERELRELGYRVDLIYENFEEFSAKAKFEMKVLHNKKQFCDNYYIKKITQKQYDIVFTIRASSLSETVIKLIKKNSPHAKLYMYQWDATKNNKNAVAIAPYFDKVSTFDVDDSKNYGWEYRPLFYIKESDRNKERNIDLTYICSLHSDRLKIYKEIQIYHGRKFLYMYSKYSHYFKEKYLKRNQEFIGISDLDMKFRPLDIEKMNEILSDSNIVVDYTHPKQTGFTMRTCEAIGHRCKLITNNKNAINADFFHPNNVYVYDSQNFYIPSDFLNSPYVELPKETYQHYRIREWLKEVLDFE